MEESSKPGFSQDPEHMRVVYARRFGETSSSRARAITWDVLTKDWLPRWIDQQDVVLELGAGRCEFINSVEAGRRIAVDLNEDLVAFAESGVETIVGSASSLAMIPDESVDVVFSSNFFEHLPDVTALIGVLAESHRVLRHGGKLITLMPNARVVGGRFWDFLDHSLPLTDASLNEALDLSGFLETVSIPRFLPYTAVGSSLPTRRAFVRAYVRLPIAWRFLGGQMFSVAVKR